MTEIEDKAETVQLNIQRGDPDNGTYMRQYSIKVDSGMVILDAIHEVQATQAGDLAVRWNCKAGKCGSCSAEVNGKPKLTCMTKLSDYPPGKPIELTPMRTFPLIKDLVTDVSWNYKVKKKLKPYAHTQKSVVQDLRLKQIDVDRMQEFRKCIECYLCQDVCHVLRVHDLKDDFVGPRFLIWLANLEMHPWDNDDRLEEIKEDYGLGLCNITKCCTEVCPEAINITDNAIIPLKERVADRYYDPLKWLYRKLFRR